MAIEVVPASNADLPSIVDLVRSGLGEFGYDYSPEDSEQDLRDLESSYAARGGTFQLARDASGRIVGCYGIYPLDPKGAVAKLRKMYVAEVCRGQGLGRRLLDHAIAFCRSRDMREIWLETTPRMHAAQGLYRSAGFTTVDPAQAPDSESPRCSVVFRLRLDEVAARGGCRLPRWGQGTWRMGESTTRRGDERRALQLGLDLGLRLIDTAEMYADGAAESVVGEAIRDRRDQVFLVSKVLPHHADRAGTLAACEASLRRLGTDRLDLYLLHWAGPHPLEQTYAAFERLVDQGKILHYGVSNFDVDEMARSESTPGGAVVAVNQVLYNLTRRWADRRLRSWCREREIAVMAYSPLEQARLQPKATLRRIADKHAATPYQVALAWTVRAPGMVTLPKATSEAHVRENAGAMKLRLDDEDCAALDEAYPQPPPGHDSIQVL